MIMIWYWRQWSWWSHPLSWAQGVARGCGPWRGPLKTMHPTYLCRSNVQLRLIVFVSTPLSSQTFGIIFTLGMGALIENVGILPANLAISSALLVGTVGTALIKADLRRQAAGDTQVNHPCLGYIPHGKIHEINIWKCLTPTLCSSAINYTFMLNIVMLTN